MYFKWRICKYIESEIAKPAIFFLHIYICRQYEAVVNQQRKIYNRTPKLISEKCNFMKNTASTILKQSFLDADSRKI